MKKNSGGKDSSKGPFPGFVKVQIYRNSRNALNRQNSNPPNSNLPKTQNFQKFETHQSSKRPNPRNAQIFKTPKSSKLSNPRNTQIRKSQRKDSLRDFLSVKTRTNSQRDSDSRPIFTLSYLADRIFLFFLQKSFKTPFAIREFTDIIQKFLKNRERNEFK